MLVGRGAPQTSQPPKAPRVQDRRAVVTRTDAVPLQIEAHIVRVGGEESVIRLRTIASPTDADPPTPRRVEMAGLTIDFPHHVAIREGVSISLTPTETRVLAELVRAPGDVLTVLELVERVWGTAEAANAGLVRHVVSRLRKKIEPDRDRPTHILTIPGGGYTFAPDLMLESTT